MNCAKARELLPLYAGGDIPQDEVAALEQHLQQCSDCAAELAALKQSLAALPRLAEKDRPDPLPEDFAWQVQAAAERRASAPVKGAWRRHLRRWRPQVSLTGVAAVVLLALVVAWESFDQAEQPASDTGQPDAVHWDEIKSGFASCMDGPYRLEDWDIPGQAGVFAVMHKPDPANQPDVYVIDYCGEAGKLSAIDAYPWFGQRVRKMIARAGSKENVYVAVCLLQQSDRQTRREIEKALIEEYNPYFNVRKGV